MPSPDPSSSDDTILLTIFLQHQQQMNLAEINEKLDETGFWREFPPDGVEVESWYVMMGVGQVVTLRVPAAKLREVNLAIEQRAWGAFETEFFPTYDFRPVFERLRKEAGARAAPAREKRARKPRPRRGR